MGSARRCPGAVALARSIPRELDYPYGASAMTSAVGESPFWQVVEMTDCPCDGTRPHDEPLTIQVAWKDGRIDHLPCACMDCDFSIREVGENLQELGNGGSFNENSFPGAFIAAYLWRIKDDVYLVASGDVDEWMDAVYVRAPLLSVVEFWLGWLSHLPVGDLLVAEHYGLLAGLADYEGCYPVSLFEPDANKGLMFCCSLDAPDDIWRSLVAGYEEDGVTWPKEVAAGIGDAARAWNSRAAAWRAELAELDS